MNGGEACVEVLRQAGVGCVFGLLGGSMLELYDALARERRVRYIGARDERAAGHMADAFARVSGGPGVVLGAQAGPGVANLVTAVAEAHLAYSPLVVIAGAISRSDQGKDTFQEIDQVALFASIAKRSFMVTSAARLTSALREAMHLALSGRRGPVVLHVPRDLFAERVEPPVGGAVETAAPGGPTPAQVEVILDRLAKAERPIIFAGGGFKTGGAPALRRLAEHLSVPVVCSTGHADLLPTTHPLNAGQTGPRGNRVAAGLTREADLILALGTRLAFNSTFLTHEYLSAEAAIVQVDVEAAAVGRYYPLGLGIQAGAQETAEALLLALGPAPSTERWPQWLQSYRAQREALDEERAAETVVESLPLDPRRVLAEVRETLPPEALVTLDTGNTSLLAADRLKLARCPALVAPLDFGLVGFGYAAALGAAAADEHRPVVSVMGDGGFGYTMAELTTAVANRLHVVAVVLDNRAWGAEKAYQQTYFGGRIFGADVHSPRLDEFARLCGADGYHVTRPGETAAALGEALQRRSPAVLHVEVDPAAISPLRKDLFAQGAGAKDEASEGGNG